MPHRPFSFLLATFAFLQPAEAQRPIGLKRTNSPSRQHIHAVIRTPNGNDYGKSLLQQHYETHHK